MTAAPGKRLLHPSGKEKILPAMGILRIHYWGLLLLAAFLPGLLGCSSSLQIEPPASPVASSVVVQDEQAWFFFPVTQKESWSWFQKSTRTNAPEYQWMVEAEGPEARYAFGFSLFKFPGSSPAQGRLEELIEAGQTDLWKFGKPSIQKTRNPNVARASVTSTLVRGVPVHAEVVENHVAISLPGDDTVDMLFKNRPDMVSFRVITPSRGRVRDSVRVRYRSADRSE